MLKVLNSVAIAIGLCGGLVSAHANTFTGTFALSITDPGSEPLLTPFGGTYSFETTVFDPPLHSESQLFNIRVLAADLNGGDEVGGCCYVLDTIASQPDIVYRISGDPFSLSLLFLNTSLGTRVAIGFASPVSAPTLRWSQDKLNPSGTFTGIRGGTYTFDAPTLHVSPVPEPSSAALFAAALLAYKPLRRRFLKGPSER